MALLKKDVGNLLLVLTIISIVGCSGTKNTLSTREYQADFKEMISITKQAVQSVGLQLQNGEYLDKTKYQITAVEIINRIGNEPVQTMLLTVDLDQMENNTTSVKVSSPNKRYVMASSGSLESNNYREKIFNMLDKMTEEKEKVAGK